jgi:hypothetical protein
MSRLRLVIALLALPWPAAADHPVSDVHVDVGGYGELSFSWLGYGDNRNREGGAASDSRLVFDETRFVVEAGALLPGDVEFEAEVEFEHGGTGSAMELDYEEFGEFETEVERGGEVNLEELFLEKHVGDHLRLRLGRFYVALGLLGERHRPTELIGAGRPEAETLVVPGVWNEMGADALLTFGPLRLTLQVVNGLDSSGFSSQLWVASGHQQRFELVRASDLAFVARADWRPSKAVEVGASGYYGGTSRNRPKADLVPACTRGDAHEVAPCGYVGAAVAIGDVHGFATIGPLRLQGAALLGHLQNADRISERNARLSNQLQALRSPVSDNALGAWVEAGWDVLSGVAPDHRLEPFVRLEHLDTMFRPRESLYDNPRFERTLLSAGAGYTGYDHLTAKLAYVRRSFGSDRLAVEHEANLAVGFIY